ncbi:hypothetical protein D3C85_1093080 [compost metagenome]
MVVGFGPCCDVEERLVVAPLRTGLQGLVGYLRNLNINNLSVFSDNAAAASLTVGDLYRTSTGQIMIRY